MTRFNHRDDLWTNGTVLGGGAGSFGIHEPLWCLLTGQSSPLWISKYPSYVGGGAENQLGCQIDDLKITQALNRDMKRQATNKRRNENSPFKPRFLSSTSCVWFQGQCGCTEWHYRAKNACLPFLVRASQP